MKQIPDSIFEQHIAITGKVGSGKTYSARGFVERLLTAGRRVCIIDPTGAWHGLRSSADGKRAGFPVVVFGGDHGDVPITAASAAPLARMIAEQNLPCVIDVSGLLIGEQRQFMAEFAEKIFQLNRKPLHLVIDESDIFAPQNPQRGDEKMLHRVDRIVRRGRIRGFRVTLITQRPAVLHKNVLTQANVLISMRLTAPQDRKALEEWIKGQGDTEKGRQVLASLAGLPTGEGWVWAPELDILERMKFPRITTFDSGRTPDDDGEVAEPVRLADVDLTEINAALADAIKEAAENDPRALRAEIAKLKRQAAEKPLTIDAKASEAEKEQAWTDGYAQGKAEAAGDAEAARVAAYHEGYVGGWNELLDRVAVAIERHRGPGNIVVEGMRPGPSNRSGMRSTNPTPRLRNARHTSASPPSHEGEKPEVRRSGKTSDLPRGELATLKAIAQYPNGATREQLSVLTGYKRSSRDAYIQRLKEKGFAEIMPDGPLVATGHGIAALGSDYEPLPTGVQLQDYWLGRLPEGERAVLHFLLGVYPASPSRDKIDEVTGYKRSSRDAYIQRLKSRQLVTIESRGEVRASDHLFG
jgi:hypothetical protein